MMSPFEKAFNSIKNGKIEKELLESNLDNEHWNNALRPLHNAMVEGHDEFEYINPIYDNHMNERLTERLPMNQHTNQSPQDAHVRFNPIVNQGDDKHIHNDFLHMGNLKLEHLMRNNPNLLDNIEPGNSLSLQVAHDSMGYKNPDANMSSPHLMRNSKDMHIVYRRDGKNRFKPVTIQPTPDFTPTDKTKFMVANPEYHMGLLNNHERNTLHGWMKNHNEKHGFDDNLYFPKDSYDKSNAKAKPEEVVEERELHSLSNGLTPELSSHWKYSAKNQRLESKGVLGKKMTGGREGRKEWWAGDNGFGTRAGLIQNEHKAGNISRDDKMLMYNLLIQHAINSGISKDEINPNYYFMKNNMPHLVNDEDYAEAIMSIKKAERMKLKYRLLKHDVMVLKNMLKERKTPEAMRHKREYDTKYESSPDRIKYREELNRERQKRGMYGDHSHRDISHTAGGKLTVEGEHENRQRHFKDKGTLRPLTKAVREDLELLRNLMNGPMDDQDKKIAQAVMASLEERESESADEDEGELSHPYFGGSPIQLT